MAISLHTAHTHTHSDCPRTNYVVHNSGTLVSRMWETDYTLLYLTGLHKFAVLVRANLVTSGLVVGDLSPVPPSGHTHRMQPLCCHKGLLREQSCCSRFCISCTSEHAHLVEVAPYLELDSRSIRYTPRRGQALQRFGTSLSTFYYRNTLCPSGCQVDNKLTSCNKLHVSLLPHFLADESHPYVDTTTCRPSYLLLRCTAVVYASFAAPPRTRCASIHSQRVGTPRSLLPLVEHG